MDVKINYVCGICQKAFTKNSSLKRYRTIVHLSTRYNCLTCPKTYRRREDLIKHSKVCLKATLEDDTPENIEAPSTNVKSTPNALRDLSNAVTPPKANLNTVIEDLTLSDSKEEDTTPMGKEVENQILTSSISRQTNTEISCLKMVDKATNTEPLIVISPDDILELGEKLSLLTFDKSLKIFVDTINSNYIYCKPRLSRSSTPTTQIGLLNAQPSACKGSQTKITPDFPTIDPPTLLDMPTTLELNEAGPSTVEPESTTQDIEVHPNSITPHTSGIETPSNINTSLHTTPTMEEMCQRKPTRPSLFIPPCKRTKLAAVLKKELRTDI